MLIRGPDYDEEDPAEPQPRKAANIARTPYRCGEEIGQDDQLTSRSEFAAGASFMANLRLAVTIQEKAGWR